MFTKSFRNELNCHKQVVGSRKINIEIDSGVIHLEFLNFQNLKINFDDVKTSGYYKQS